jgi:hypothetical protein
MNENFNFENKNKHLIEGVKPIIACVGSFEDFGIKDPYPKNAPEYEIDLKLKNAQFIDIDSSKDKLAQDKFLNAGEKTYVISEINDADKFSKKFHRCTGLIVSGIDKTTGKNISFVSHQDPFKFLLDDKEKFKNDLKEKIKEIKEKCREGTIDAVIVGGIFYTDTELDNFQVMETYKTSIDLLGKETSGSLGFEPIVINGPKTSRIIGDDIYFDNENRRLYFLRPKVNQNTGDFIPSDIENQKEKWG